VGKILPREEGTLWNTPSFPPPLEWKNLNPQPQEVNPFLVPNSFLPIKVNLTKDGKFLAFSLRIKVPWVWLIIFLKKPLGWPNPSFFLTWPIP